MTRRSSVQGRRSKRLSSDSIGSTEFSSMSSRRTRRWWTSRAVLPTAIKVFSGLISPARARPSRTVIVGPICEASLAFGKNKMTRLRTELRPKRLQLQDHIIKGIRPAHRKTPSSPGQEAKGSSRIHRKVRGSPGNLAKDNSRAQGRADKSGQYDQGQQAGSKPSSQKPGDSIQGQPAGSMPSSQ